MRPHPTETFSIPPDLLHHVARLRHSENARTLIGNLGLKAKASKKSDSSD
nr:hypothetical protein HUO10_002796 [Paraburkholderia busanensis]